MGQVRNGVADFVAIEILGNKVIQRVKIRFWATGTKQYISRQGTDYLLYSVVP